MLAFFLAQVTTTTTEVKRVVGDPPATWVVLLSSALVLGAILGAGLWARQRRD